ncbi:hypothetical protein CEP52_014273 [Fusarium oligoseptatum]|uniref:C2H2-type domain-containing protein n=1 Tax=Fusarium oligoseptatum TaxID=2604345 RepID=A0A428SNP5_9HYPO|nr:hypothetical protein CEP52_014273 [Fusarium oligoseptatum]
MIPRSIKPPRTSILKPSPFRPSLGQQTTWVHNKSTSVADVKDDFLLRLLESSISEILPDTTSVISAVSETMKTRMTSMTTSKKSTTFCVDCDEQFTSNRDNHKITHAAKDIECAGCYRLFVSNSAMVLHLEAGTCPSEADNQTVHELAFECRQSQYYYCDDPEYDYECPTCETPFRYMSGLLQHVENGPCDEDLSWHSPLAIFLRFIRARI